ncbi:unnamed protein product [Clonostachys rosea f. rosea IK726]|uniref:Uncharacterized protein n=1 Tax=Clonostachys rosea f. rosea IK726 TaxID=1349383 RepID=A0ACA9U1J4_BIOOC|nr:unnamed protein product [Clonostachys rosea f. rosea IK726]
MDNPNAQTPFLQLHSDAFRAIVEELSDHTKVLLSQTCRSIRHMLQKEKIVPALSAPEHVRLLVHLSRGNPDVWVCATCKKQHPVTEGDLWGDNQFSSCPNRKFSRRREGMCRINYARVQLALKYSRFAIDNARIDSHLRRLIRPEGSVLRVKHRHNLAEFTSSSRPRVIDGRFLVKYTWKYRLHSGSYTPSKMPSMMVCDHQRLLRPADGVVWGEERKQLFRTVLQAMLDDRNGVEYCGSCPFCPTDFTVRSFDNLMRIDAWKDFGPEDGPSNPTWKSHSLSEAQRTPKDRGTVRRLYYEIY